MITATDIEPVDAIRTAKVLQAREAISRNAMDVPEIWDESLDLMVTREGLDAQYDERAAERDLMDKIVLGDIDTASKCAFWTDYED